MMNFGTVDKIRLVTLDRNISWILGGCSVLCMWRNLEMVAGITRCRGGNCLVKNFQQGLDCQYMFLFGTTLFLGIYNPIILAQYSTIHL